MTATGQRQPGAGVSPGAGRQTVKIEEHELLRVTAFCLRGAAARIVSLGSQASSPGVSARLLALARELETQAECLEREDA
jgi:hypothetical protein